MTVARRSFGEGGQAPPQEVRLVRGPGPRPANEGLFRGAGGLGSLCKEELGRVFCILSGAFGAITANLTRMCVCVFCKVHLELLWQSDFHSRIGFQP